MAISFNLVPANIRVPGQYIEIDNSKAVNGLSGMPTKVLLIGQKLDAGIQDPLIPVLITSVEQGREYFGVGSMLAHMIEKFKGANEYVEVHAIAQVDKAAGAFAQGGITFGGTTTESGTLKVYVGGRRVDVGVSAGDNGAALATKLVAAIGLEPDLAVTAVVDGDVTSKVNITAKHKGECGNLIDIRIGYYTDERKPAGMTATVAAMAGGTGNPDVTDVIDAIGDAWYTDIVMPYNDTSNIEAMEAELITRFGPLKQIPGHCYIGLSDTHANLVTKGQTQNSPHLTFAGFKKSPTPAYEVAAVLGAQCAYYGNIDPARPLQTLPMPGVMAPVVADRFTLVENNLLLFSGVSTFEIGNDGSVYISRIITTYRENPFGAADPSYLDIETVKTVCYLRYDVRTFIALRFPRYKLANDGTPFASGQAVVTPSVIRAALIARALMWAEQGLVEDIEQFKNDLIVERDPNDTDRINALIPPNIINGLRVFAGLVQFRL